MHISHPKTFGFGVIATLLGIVLIAAWPQIADSAHKVLIGRLVAFALIVVSIAMSVIAYRFICKLDENNRGGLIAFTAATIAFLDILWLKEGADVLRQSPQELIMAGILFLAAGSVLMGVSAHRRHSVALSKT